MIFNINHIFILSFSHLQVASLSISSVQLALKQPNADFVPPANSIGVWFTQAHSCQRDLILALRAAPFADQLHIVASHGQIRPEITSVADIAFLEPALEERIDWIFEQAQRLNVRLMITGRYSRIYLEQKQRFEAAGIRLMAGTNSLDCLTQLHDKSEFTDICQQHDIAVVPATKVNNTDELIAAINDWSSRGEVCVKPVHGVFAAGFWHLDANATAFDCFANSANFKASPQVFIDSYRQLAEPPAYLVMPFLNDIECSVDMFCANGQLMQAVVRYKHDNEYQSLHLSDPARDLAVKISALFECDGLINMQARYSAEGELYILEVNPRPSGGIGYTVHSGVNLVSSAVAYALGFEDNIRPMMADDTCITVRAIATSVRVDA